MSSQRELPPEDIAGKDQQFENLVRTAAKGNGRSFWLAAIGYALRQIRQHFGRVLVFVGLIALLLIAVHRYTANIDQRPQMEQRIVSLVVVGLTLVGILLFLGIAIYLLYYGFRQEGIAFLWNALVSDWRGEQTPHPGPLPRGRWLLRRSARKNESQTESTPRTDKPSGP